ncbi:MAG: AAA family ATPase [Undibacterium umbellatum]|uniref:ATP-dependent nuclease n=1 Tax=Undibacterium umbellatum TaxID=2762300 RepID=UPI003BB4BA52
MPSGWLAYIRIIGWLRGEEIIAGSICLIEEPEVHLHPSLQRTLMSRMNELAIEKKLQLLITSHSPLFINLALTLKNAKLFGVNPKNRLEEITIPEVLLKDLDVKGSDILQTNGVIWVEGESDKIYLKYWISPLVSQRFS